MPDDTTKLYIKESNEKEREVSDDRYAAKLIERIVIGILAAFGLAIVAKLITVVGL